MRKQLTDMPKYALFFLLFTMASIGLPGTSGFVGEFLSLAGIYQVSSWVTLVLLMCRVAAALVKLPVSTTRAKACIASKRSIMHLS
jgi:NADH:ubiquinone oxidoreductase subunit 4 (subunit M)